MPEIGSRSLARAIVWRTAFLVTQAGLSFGVFVALAHILPPDEYAAIAVAQGALVVAQAIGDFGLSQAATSLLPARIAAAPEREAILVSSAAAAYLGCALAALTIAAGTALVLPGDAVLPVLAIAPAAALSAVVSGADGLLRARGSIRRPVLLVLLSRVGLLAAIPVAAATDSATVTALAVSAGAVAGAVPSVRYVLSALRSAPRVPGATRAFVRSALPLGFSQILTQAIGRINTLVIGALASLTAGAAFEASWRLFQLGQYVVGAVATATSPALGSAIGGGRNTDAVRTILRLALLLLVAGVAVAGFLLALRGPLAHGLFDELGNTVATAIVPLILVTPLAFLGFFATTVLAARDEFRRDVAIGSLVGGAVNLGCLAFAVERSARGACLASALGVGAANVYLVARLAALVQQLRRTA